MNHKHIAGLLFINTNNWTQYWSRGVTQVTKEKSVTTNHNTYYIVETTAMATTIKDVSLTNFQIY